MAKVNKAKALDLYFNTLCDYIFIGEPGNNYGMLMKALFRKDFVWQIPNDDNRGADGLQLRERIINDILNNDNKHNVMAHTLEFEMLFSRPCNVLEMLIALADRMAFIIDSVDDEPANVKCFWELIHNLGLSRFNDEYFFDLYNMLEAEEIVNRFLSRNYEKNGKGGLFPLKHTNEDQRNVEIWYQMNAYLAERYNFND